MCDRCSFALARRAHAQMDERVAAHFDSADVEQREIAPAAGAVLKRAARFSVGVATLLHDHRAVVGVAVAADVQTPLVRLSAHARSASTLMSVHSVMSCRTQRSALYSASMRSLSSRSSRYVSCTAFACSTSTSPVIELPYVTRITTPRRTCVALCRSAALAARP